MRIAPPFLAMAAAGLALSSLVALTRQGPALMAPQPGGLAVALQPQHPLPELPLRGLPAGVRSDHALRAALGKAPGGEGLLELLAARGLVERATATVEALVRDRLPREALPLAPPAAFPLAARARLDEAHFVRYEPYVRALESVEPAAVTALYLRMYPLFQEAWSRRAKGPHHFNDAVVAAIDHLAETPAPAAPVMLAQRGRVMVFEDPALERRSAGQKLMLRMGEHHARRVKAVLAALRARITLRAANE